VTPCCVVQVNQCFGGTCYFSLQSRI
jgi:hypothetical protein